MLKLFKIEWMKISSYKAFWILFGAFAILFPITLMTVAKQFMDQFTGKTMEEVAIKSMLGSPFIFPKIWLSSAWFGGLFFLIIGMLFIMLVTNEVQYRTHRQNIIDGWSRMDYLKAKTSLLLFFVLTATAIVFISGLITGLIFSPSDSYRYLLDGSYYILYFAIMATIYLLVAFFIAIFVKRTGLAIIVYFALVCIIDNLLWAGLTFRGNQLGYFLPLEVADSLVPNPFTPSALKKRTLDDWALIVGSGVYIAALGYLLTKHFTKSDLKN